MKAAETDLAPSVRAFRSGGTESSNPASSGGESIANRMAPGAQHHHREFAAFRLSMDELRERFDEAAPMMSMR